MTTETMDAPAVAAPTATPPHPLREFWGYFSANHGAVAGLVVIVTVVLKPPGPDTAMLAGTDCGSPLTTIAMLPDETVYATVA